MKQRLFFTLFLILISTSTTLAAELNAGIVKGLWYSQDKVFADSPVRIYVAIRNSTGGDLTGTVTFYDNETKINSQSVSALSGRIIESWSDWKPTYGNHKLSATLSKVKLSQVGSSTNSAEVTVATTEDSLFVDYDTDKDGIGNEVDTDDDGDNISDEAEKTVGSDPLKYDQPITTSHDTNDDSAVIVKAGHETAKNHSEEVGGLERYLTPSRADSILSGITDWTESVKQTIDNYRETRAKEKANADKTNIEVNEDGFGEVTRTTKTEASKPKTEMPTGFFGDIVRVTGTILSGLATVILATLSWLLGNPMLVQLLLLILILFGTVFFARKLGARPHKK